MTNQIHKENMHFSRSIEPRWVLVNSDLCNVSDFVHLQPRQRPHALCPLCRSQVILKLGPQRIHHYAHVHDAPCASTNPETALHLNTKFYMHNQLLCGKGKELFFEQQCMGCDATNRHVWLTQWDSTEVEYHADTFRPDIALIDNSTVIGAIEILVTHAVSAEKSSYVAIEHAPITKDSFERLSVSFRKRLDFRRTQGVIVDNFMKWLPWEQGENLTTHEINKYPFRYIWDGKQEQWVTSPKK